MGLPKLDIPFFELDLPISERKIKYRPFLVKEEKILLIAQESGDADSLVNALIQIVNNCVVDEIDVGELPMVELEYIFLNLRAKSVDNKQTMRLVDTEDEQTYEVDVIFDEVKIQQQDVQTKIDLTDNVGLIMKIPNVSRMLKIQTAASTDNPADTVVAVFKACIDKVYDAEEVYEISDHSQEEVDEFISQLTSDQFKKVQAFFDTLPKLKHELRYTNSNGNERTYTLEGLADFFL
jgi:hypothetical protein